MIPILYESGFISIQTVWVFVVLALLLSSYLAVERLKRARVNFTLLIEHGTFFLVIGLIGARLAFFLLHPDIYLPGFDLRTFKNLFAIWDQGFSFWGGALSTSLALVYQLKKADEEVSKWADALSVPFIVGVILGLAGAFLGGYSYGHPTELPWGVLYESYNVKYTVPVHPVQLYGILLFSLLLWSKRKLSKRTTFFQINGATSLYLMTSFLLISFVLEFFKGDDTLLILGIRLPQILFFLGFIASAALLYKRIQRFKLSPHGSPSTLQS